MGKNDPFSDPAKDGVKSFFWTNEYCLNRVKIAK